MTDQRVLEDVEDLLDRIGRYRVDVILLEGNLLKMPLEEFARRLRLTASEPVIFILQGTAVPENILEAMQAGAREYLCPPLGKPLKEAFERLSAVRTEQVSMQQKKLGRIFGFVSAKGGCGATTFASHVATMAAKQSEKPLLLADLDFDAGLLRFILKAKPRYSLRDAVDNMHRMDSNYWNALVTKHGRHMEFIAAPEELAERSLPDLRQLGRLLRFIRTMYPLAILDFGRCHSAAALEMLPELEALFVIVTNDLMVLENAKELIRMAEERGKGPERIRVLLNKVPTRQKPDIAGIETYLGVRVSKIYSDDNEALYETWSEGRLLGGDSVLGRQLTELAKSVTTPNTLPAVSATATSAGTKPMSLAATAGAIGLGRFLSFMRSSRA
jgi:pilus assembly protein CpaE